MPLSKSAMLANEEKRQRICVICGSAFRTKWPSSKKITCSAECLRLQTSQRQTGRVQSQASRDKRAEAMRQIWTDPDARARREASGKHSMDAFMSNPENVEKLKARSRAWVENNPEWRARQAERAKWSMRRANEALRAETDYETRFAEVQARLRREMPYDGPKEGSDYAEYLHKLGKAVTNHPELRAIADSFMAEAIPRFSLEWTRLKSESDA